jgi:hypothetical protein
MATPIWVKLSSQPVSVRSALCSALAALSALLSNAAAPLSLCPSACCCGNRTSSLRRLLMLFFFFFLSIGGGCLVPDEEEGGGVESNSLSFSADAFAANAFGGEGGGGGGGGMYGAITGCLVPEEEG